VRKRNKAFIAILAGTAVIMVLISGFFIYSWLDISDEQSEPQREPMSEPESASEPEPVPVYETEPTPAVEENPVHMMASPPSDIIRAVDIAEVNPELFATLNEEALSHNCTAGSLVIYDGNAGY